MPCHCWKACYPASATGPREDPLNRQRRQQLRTRVAFDVVFDRRSSTLERARDVTYIVWSDVAAIGARMDGNARRTGR